MDLPRPSPDLRPSLRMVTASVRRSPLLWWAVVIAVALLAGLTVQRSVSAARADARAWGTTMSVPVMTTAVAAGSAITEGDVTWRDLPRAVVPGGSAATDPVGQRAAVDLHPGEVLLAARIADGDAGPVAAALPDATVGMGVPHGQSGLVLDVGDRVDVLATVDAGTDSPPTTRIVRRALVVDVNEDGVTLAVPSDAAPRLAFALVAGVVTLALAG
ncbi:MAG TPA: SAF domain-containing protein [Acidimicrobiales bacterium]